MIAELVEELGRPLVATVAGALFTGLVAPRIAQAWQDQRKATEIRHALLERVVASVTAIRVASQFAMLGGRSQTQEAFSEAYRHWVLERASLTVLLEAQLSDEHVNRLWIRCRSLATAWYVRAGIQESRLRSYLEAVRQGLDRPDPRDLSEEALNPAYGPLPEPGQAIGEPDLVDLFRHIAAIEETLAALATAINSSGRIRWRTVRYHRPAPQRR